MMMINAKIKFVNEVWLHAPCISLQSNNSPKSCLIHFSMEKCKFYDSILHNDGKM